MTNEKLMKLYRLAQRGVGGEQANAERMLYNALKRAGMTLDELLGADEEPVEASFMYSTKFERMLLFQIVGKVLNSTSVSYRKVKRGPVIFDLSPSQAVEVQLMFDVYKRAWAKELEHTLSAFIATNDIYAADQSNAGPSKLSPEELKDIRRKMMAMEPTPVRKAITRT